MRFIVVIAACIVVSGCGIELPGNSRWKGSWNSFSVNGAPSQGGFLVDDHGRFDFSVGDSQVSGAITPDGRVSGSAHSLSVPGSCTLSGNCNSTSVCAGTATGGGCPSDASARPWTTFAFCRGAGC